MSWFPGPRPNGSDVSYDPETLAVLKSAFENSWRNWLARQTGPVETAVAFAARQQLAWRIMQLAASGERDPALLQNKALDDDVPPANVA
jgi:hypothetical protein